MNKFYDYLLYFVCWEKFKIEEICPESALEIFELKFGEKLAKELNVYECLDESGLFISRGGAYRCCEAKALSENEKMFLRFVKESLSESPICFRKRNLIMELMSLDEKLRANKDFLSVLERESYACKCAYRSLISALRNFFDFALCNK